jgi:hypothetical protein
VQAGSKYIYMHIYILYTYINIGRWHNEIY